MQYYRVHIPIPKEERRKSAPKQDQHLAGEAWSSVDPCPAWGQLVLRELKRAWLSCPYGLAVCSLHGAFLGLCVFVAYGSMDKYSMFPGLYCSLCL